MIPSKVAHVHHDIIGLWRADLDCWDASCRICDIRGCDQVSYTIPSVEKMCSEWINVRSGGFQSQLVPVGSLTLVLLTLAGDAT